VNKAMIATAARASRRQLGMEEAPEAETVGSFTGIVTAVRDDPL